MFVTLDEIYKENKKDHAGIVSDMKTIREIVTGNGDPEKGLIVRHVRMEERQKAFKEDVNEIKSTMNSFRQEFQDYAKSSSNRRTATNGKVLGVIPVRVMETIWMWVVRGVIVGGLSLGTWLCGNSEDLGFILDKAKQMQIEEKVK
jgi:hypothetical protein